MTKSPAIFLIVCLIFLYSGAVAQDTDFSKFIKAYNNYPEDLFKQYQEKIGEASQILNGPEYFYDDSDRGGDPYFGDSPFYEGSIIYNGNRYDDLEIGYDIYRDIMFVARYQQGLTSYQLPVERVAGFTLDQHVFIRLIDPDSTSGHPGTGFYELLYNGKTKVIAKRRKKVVPSTEGIYKYEYGTDDEIYIVRNDAFNKVWLKSSIRKLFKEEKKSIRRYSNDNKLYLMDLEPYAVQVCRYYDSLNGEVEK